MSIFDAIDKLITERGSAAIQKVHIDLLRDQAKALEKENAELKKRVAELEGLTRDLTSSLKANATGEEFQKHRGVLFRKLEGGAFEDAVYCPTCKGPMFSLEDVVPFTCGRCNVVAGFTGESLRSKVLPELRAKHG